MGHDLAPERFRGNLWLDGAEPWAEWAGSARRLRSRAILKIEARITRCSATTVDPQSGVSDAIR